jgi:serine O-acetyltransferase
LEEFLIYENKKLEKFLQFYVSKQINNFFPSHNSEIQLESEWLDEALHKIYICFRSVKAYQGLDFDYLNSGQYSTFLYYLSNLIYKKTSNREIAVKIFLLNKALNGLDLFYEVEMPSVFLISHTSGMVFAKASYSNYCVFHQGCTVGRKDEGRPILDEGVVMFPNSMVIGNCHIRKNTVIAPSVVMNNIDSPGNCIVLNDGANIKFKPISFAYVERYFESISEVI